MNAQQTDSPLSPERVAELKRYRAELMGQMTSLTTKVRMIDRLIQDTRGTRS